MTVTIVETHVTNDGTFVEADFEGLSTEEKQLTLADNHYGMVQLIFA